MLTSILAQCLQSHKRLVVPGLGAFIVKEPGRCVVFTELLKRDDGVLRQALLDRGVGEAEAAELVDRFVSEVHLSVEQGREVCLPGLGTLRPGARETIVFVFDPDADADADAVADAGEELPAARPQSREPYSAPTAEPVAAASENAAPSAQTAQTAKPAAPAEKAAPTVGQPASAVPTDGSKARSERLAATLRSAYEERPVSTSARMSPDPAVRGLRYSEPLKTTDAYTYVGSSSHRHHHRHHHHRRSSGWLVWVVAVLAIVIAVGTILYYQVWSPWQERRELDRLLEQAGMTASPAQSERPGLDDASFLEPESVEP